MLRPLLGALCVALVTTAANAATFTQLNFDKNFDHIGSHSINGPTGLSSGNQGTGIEFDISADGDGHDVWHSEIAPGANPKTLTIATALFGVSKVHTLMNTWWGSSNPNLASVSFQGTNGASASFAIIGGQHVRDFNENPAYTNTLNAPNATAWWTDGGTGSGSQRLDLQSWDLGTTFLNETLTSITFSDSGKWPVQRIFVAGVTAEVAPVPLPAASLLLLSGFAGLGIMRARRRKTA